MNLKMTNLGVFNEYIESEIQNKIDKRKLSTDIYEQMILDSEKRLLEKILVQYKTLIVNQ